MNDPNYYCVIMAGGLGTRFWPVSRESRPKQFQTFSRSGKSFLQLAYERALEVVPEQNILVVSLERFRPLVIKDLPHLSPENLLLEPYNRNTASCIAFATYYILKRDHILAGVGCVTRCLRQYETVLELCPVRANVRNRRLLRGVGDLGTGGVVYLHFLGPAI
ncbi:MAG: hypothetical protein J6Y45_08190 [Bacteroidales bacterium]|nr:hypothetical protein [Bacteroidales bacterium]